MPRKRPGQPKTPPLGAQPARGSDQPARPRRRLLAAGVAAVMLVVAIVLIGRAWRKPTPQTLQSPLNVLLITLDTVRADHLGCYGHPERATPNLDRLARDGARFADCATAAPITLPSHATILTGQYPFVHGIRHNVGYRLTEDRLSLAELLSEAGYRTAAFVGAYVLSRDTGLDQGFDFYDDVGSRHERPGNEVVDGALAWLRKPGDEPFFLWVHLFDPHFPYEPPSAYRGRFRDPYTGEIAFADAQVGRLLAELDRLKLTSRTLVVATADHGEGLGQHGEATHLFFAYETTMAVPLIMRLPGVLPAGRVIPHLVRTVDIAPTVLALVGLGSDGAMPAAQGHSLAPLLDGSAAQPRVAYGETLSGQIVLGTAALRTLRVDGWKYIHAPRAELYYLPEDPGELQNLAPHQLDRVGVMRDRLRDLVAATPLPASDSTVRPSAEALDRLRGLGYIGEPRGGESEDASKLDQLEPAGPDPKDHAGDFAAVGQAIHLLQIGQYAEAEAAYRRLVSRFPRNAELAMQMGRAVLHQGRIDEAIAIFDKALAQDPENPHVLYGLGKLLDQAGRREEAIERFLQVVHVQPAYPEAWYDLGVALRRQTREEEAVECFRQAVRHRPTYVDARINLGAGLAAQGRLDDAIEQYQAALRSSPGDPAIHYNLANALLRQGDVAAARASYEEALRVAPGFQPAREALQHLPPPPPPPRPE